MTGRDIDRANELVEELIQALGFSANEVFALELDPHTAKVTRTLPVNGKALTTGRGAQRVQQVTRVQLAPEPTPLTWRQKLGNRRTYLRMALGY